MRAGGRWAVVAAAMVAGPAVAALPAAAALPAVGTAPALAPQAVSEVGAPADSAGFPLETAVLANGLRVIVSEDRSTPVVAVSVWHDLRGAPAVLARLVHRLLAEGGERPAPGELRRLVEGAGGTAVSGAEGGRASFQVVLPSHRLDLALWLHAERMRPLVVEDASYRLHRELLVRDLRAATAAVGAEPRTDAAMDSLAAAAAGVAHSPPDPDALESVTVEALRAFQARWLAPGNATLVVVGDVEAGEALERIRRYLGPLPSGEGGRAGTGLRPRDPAAPTDPDPAREAARALVDTGGPRVLHLPGGAGADAGLLRMGFPVPPPGTDGAALTLLASILGHEAGRLGRRLPGGGADGEVRVGMDREGPVDLFIVTVVAPPGTDAAGLEMQILEELRRVALEGVSPGELEGARNRERAAVAARTLTVSGRAEAFQEARHLWGRADALEGRLRTYDAVTSDDVRRVARRWLDPARRLVVVVGEGSVGGGLP